MMKHNLCGVLEDKRERARVTARFFDMLPIEEAVAVSLIVANNNNRSIFLFGSDRNPLNIWKIYITGKIIIVSELLTAFTTFAFGIWASKKNRFYWRWSFCHSCGRCKSAKICVGHAMSRSQSLHKVLSNFRNYHRPIWPFCLRFIFKDNMESDTFDRK